MKIKNDPEVLSSAAVLAALGIEREEEELLVLTKRLMRVITSAMSNI